MLATSAIAPSAFRASAFNSRTTFARPSRNWIRYCMPIRDAPMLSVRSTIPNLARACQAFETAFVNGVALLSFADEAVQFVDWIDVRQGSRRLEEVPVVALAPAAKPPYHGSHEEIPAGGYNARLSLGRRVVSIPGLVSSVAGGVFLAMALPAPGRAEPPNISAQRLLASWQEGEPGMKMLAEVIASAFASGMAWAGRSKVACSTARRRAHRSPATRS